jgi:hypothetical protein
MAYEAIVYDKEGKALGEVRALFDRAWVLNGYEQCTFLVSSRAELERLSDFAFGNYLVINDDVLDAWVGYFDPVRPWSTTGVMTVEAYSAERIFEHRCFPGERLLTGTAGAIFRQIIEHANAVIPWNTLIRPGDIYEGGTSRQETINPKKLYDDVLRISSRSGNDWDVTPALDENGVLTLRGNWYERRGSVKDFALEEGVNVEAKQNVLEEQGEIWNFIFAYGLGASWSDRPQAVAYDLESIARYGVRMYGLAVEATTPATVEASAKAFLAYYAHPRKTFNLTVGGRRVREDALYNAYQMLRIGDVVDLRLYSAGFENGKLGVETQVRITGMTHRGRSDLMDVTANEVRAQ